MLGDEIAKGVDFFVALDKNFSMLSRQKNNDIQIVGNAFHLPFKNKSFDYVLVNGIIHHIGFTRGVNHSEQVMGFLKELLRVCKKQVIIYEIILPRPFELLENTAAKILGKMPTYLVSLKTLKSYLEKMNVGMDGLIHKKLSELVDPFLWDAFILDYPWLKIPAIANPIEHIFFSISETENPMRG